MFKNLRLYREVFFILILPAMAACERPVQISMADDNNPPTFKLSAGAPTEVYVREGANVIWKIENDGANLFNWRRVTYGKVPSNFAQSIPANGAAPAALVEGKEYWFVAMSYPGGPTAVLFEIKNGKAVVIRIAQTI